MCGHGHDEKSNGSKGRCLVSGKPDDPLDKEEDKMWAVGLDLLVYSIHRSLLWVLSLQPNVCRARRRARMVQKWVPRNPQKQRGGGSKLGLQREN